MLQNGNKSLWYRQLNSKKFTSPEIMQHFDSNETIDLEDASTFPEQCIAVVKVISLLKQNQPDRYLIFSEYQSLDFSNSLVEAEYQTLQTVLDDLIPNDPPVIFFGVEPKNIRFIFFHCIILHLEQQKNCLEL
ncbi:hypothetical protein ACO0QE_000928 [Hanseniaspora vineae]